MGAIAAVAGVAAAGSIYSGISNAQAAGKAADAEEQAADSQIGLEQQEFSTEQNNEAPYLTAGNTALAQLLKGFQPGGQFSQGFNATNFSQSPEYAGYKFQQGQGQNGINASAAASGRSFSPATAAALGSFNQGLAETSYSSWFNQAYTQFQNQQNQEIGGLTNLTGVGQNAVAGVNQAGQAATAGEVSAEGSYGNAKAAGIEGKNAGINQAVGGATSAASSYMLGSGVQNGSISPQTAQTMLSAQNPGSSGGANAALQQQYYASLFNNNNSGGGSTGAQLQMPPMNTNFQMPSGMSATGTSGVGP